MYRVFMYKATGYKGWQVIQLIDYMINYPTDNSITHLHINCAKIWNSHKKTVNNQVELKWITQI